jgi:hypothetical protein
MIRRFHLVEVRRIALGTESLGGADDVSFYVTPGTRLSVSISQEFSGTQLRLMASSVGYNWLLGALGIDKEAVGGFIGR